MTTQQDKTFQYYLHILPSLLEPVAKISALVGGALYVAGFLIINAYLAKYDLSDYNVINSRFVFAGASFFLVCIIWWIICGRLYYYKDLTGLTVSPGYGRANHILTFSAQASLLIARSATASLVVCFVMFGSGIVVVPGLFIIATIIFLEAIVAQSQDREVEPSKAILVIRSALSISALVVFFVMFRPAEDVTIMFYWILSLEAVALPLGESIKNNNILDFKPFVSSIYYVLMILFYTTSYGNKFFDKIQPRAGGGLIYNATISTKDSINILGLVKTNDNIIKGKMLYLNDKLAVMKIQDNIVAIAADQIKATLIDTKPDVMLVYRMSKSMRRLGIPWKFDPFGNHSSVKNKGAIYSLDKSFDLVCYFGWQLHCGVPIK